MADTPVPANTTDSVAAGYVVAAHSPLLAGPQTKVMLWHVSSAAGVPNLFSDGEMIVSSYNVPATAPQPGTSNTLDTLDARLTQAVARFDSDAGAEAIWTQHTVAGPSGRSAVAWYEMLPATLSVRQQGQAGSATDWLFNAAISPSSAGNDAALFYNRSSQIQLPVVATQSRRSITLLGTMDPGETLLLTSLQPDVDISCTPVCRWGDYSGATPDPMVAHAVWGSNQLTGPSFLSLPQWATINFAVYVSP
jgi:hypothetical protein